MLVKMCAFVKMIASGVWACQECLKLSIAVALHSVCPVMVYVGYFQKWKKQTCEKH